MHDRKWLQQVVRASGEACPDRSTDDYLRHVVSSSPETHRHAGTIGQVQDLSCVLCAAPVQKQHSCDTRAHPGQNIGIE